MLRILRRIKLGKATGENSSTFWRFALGEFILVFLGILIALQVDNWNQDRKEQKLERVLLSEMRSNLKGDLEDLEFNINYQKERLYSNQVVLDFLNSELPWHDSLGIHFARLIGAGLFDSNPSAYESLKTIGIDLIRNDSLRQNITGVYTVVYHHVKANEKMLFDLIFDKLYTALNENLRTVSLREIAVPVNLDELKQNNSFKENLNMSLFIYSLTLRSFERGSESIRTLITDIEEELGLDPEAPT
jgi:hypothetical protein